MLPEVARSHTGCCRLPELGLDFLEFVLNPSPRSTFQAASQTRGGSVPKDSKSPSLCWCRLKKPEGFSRLCSCSIPPSCCQGLASVLLSAQRLETLDLGQNILGRSGITVLLEALKQNNGPLKSLRLEMDESSTEIQKLLKDVKDINPNLTIECSDARATRSLWGELLPLHPEDLLSDPVP
ncbi:NACHT, LRR and PYD domains-containing protein 5-like [Suricata suricatta]|uniref:NACHT, LRR and PYD domains-containing protein 5-like n=1 Tax=Suricata suricatta TaxID=37032 RepID=UPI001155DB08|nr:NACHT, LRR and PYD domains-containing protein 5-like [Suricata suricatta]